MLERKRVVVVAARPLEQGRGGVPLAQAIGVDVPRLDEMVDGDVGLALPAGGKLAEEVSEVEPLAGQRERERIQLAGLFAATIVSAGGEHLAQDGGGPGSVAGAVEPGLGEIAEERTAGRAAMTADDLLGPAEQLRRGAGEGMGAEKPRRRRVGQRLLGVVERRARIAEIPGEQRQSKVKGGAAFRVALGRGLALELGQKLGQRGDVDRGLELAGGCHQGDGGGVRRVPLEVLRAVKDVGQGLHIIFRPV
jgi:hypothetical protein